MKSKLKKVIIEELAGLKEEVVKYPIIEKFIPEFITVIENCSNSVLSVDKSGVLFKTSKATLESLEDLIENTDTGNEYYLYNQDIGEVYAMLGDIVELMDFILGLK